MNEMAWHMYICVDCVSCVSVSSVSLDVKILCKNNAASQVKGRQRPFWLVSVFFGVVGKKSVHGRPSWELASYDCRSQNTKDFAAWCKLESKEWRFNDRAGECRVVRFTTQFSYNNLDKAKALPIRIGNQTVWGASCLVGFHWQQK